MSCQAAGVANRKIRTPISSKGAAIISIGAVANNVGEVESQRAPAKAASGRPVIGQAASSRAARR